MVLNTMCESRFIKKPDICCRYWNAGEPNDSNNEDCVAVYPKANPFMSWNDAPCSYNLKWICEMSPKAMGSWNYS